MAAKKELNLTEEMTFVSEPKVEKHEGPTVRIYLPRLEEEGNGVKVDQYEHVTIANELGSNTWYIRRGEWVDVPVAVYVVMKEKYPDL